jgi:hypothetical protein
MRVAAIIIGALLLLVAVRGTETDSAPGANDGKGFWPLLKKDFEPGQKGNFFAWFAAILVIGALGYIPHLKQVSTLMLTLVTVVLIIGAIKKNPNLLQQAAATVTEKAG